MTQRDYINIVDGLMSDTRLKPASRVIACMALAPVFRRDNPRFKQDVYQRYVEAKLAMISNNNDV